MKIVNGGNSLAKVSTDFIQTLPGDFNSHTMYNVYFARTGGERKRRMGREGVEKCNPSMNNFRANSETIALFCAHHVATESPSCGDCTY